MQPILLLLFLAPFTFGSGHFVFDETLVTVEAGTEDDFVEAKFFFTVKGEQNAIVKKFAAPCSCLKAKIGEDNQEIWKPGEKGYVTGTFEVGSFRGTVKKHIHITMADGKNHQLTVAMTTPKLITIEPKTLKWKAGETANEKIIKITLDPQYPVNIESISNSNPKQFDQQLETLKEGKEYQLRITPMSTDSRALGVVKILTDSRSKRHKTYQAFVVVEQKGLVPNRPKK